MHSWRKIRLGELLLRSKIPIVIEDKKTYSRVTIRTKHQGVSKRDDEVGKKIGTKKQFLLKNGQFVMSKIDARYGAFGIAEQNVHDAIITGNFWAYDINQDLTTVEWIERYTNSASFYDLCERASSGITHRKYLNEKVFLSHELYIPSKEDQANILIKLEKEQKSLNKLTTENQNQSSYLTQLRQAILQEAIEGKLTADWRKENPVRKGDPDYDAGALLEKIKAEKEKLVKEGKIKKQKPLAPIKLEDVPFELPEGWVWTRLGEIADSILGKMLDKAKNQGKYYNYLRNLNVRWFDFDLEDLKKIRLQEHEVGKYSAYKNDLLICEGGYPGRSAIWENDEPIVFQKAIHRVRSFLSDHNEWILSNLKLLDMNRNIEKYFTGAGIKHLTGVKLKTIEIPLPPLSEMKIILERIKSFLFIVDELENQVLDRKEQSEQLMQAVLQEAFEGKSHA